jgi:Ca2+-binding EF-hand superfamily protein
MTRTWVLALLTCASIAVLADPHAGHGPGSERLKGWDTNSDGVITRQEADAKGAEHVSRVFDKLDVDKDGRLTEDEVSKGREAHKGAMHERFDERIKAADKNSDGMLTLDEAQAGLPKLAERFNEVDTNKDGQVSKDELRAQHRQHSTH